jgi:hypothetical protein
MAAPAGFAKAEVLVLVATPFEKGKAESQACIAQGITRKRGLIRKNMACFHFPKKKIVADLGTS